MTLAVSKNDRAPYECYKDAVFMFAVIVNKYPYEFYLRDTYTLLKLTWTSI